MTPPDQDRRIWVTRSDGTRHLADFSDVDAWHVTEESKQSIIKSILEKYNLTRVPPEQLEPRFPVDRHRRRQSHEPLPELPRRWR